jgi:hypothetical protein
MNAQHTPGPWWWEDGVLNCLPQTPQHNGKTCQECGHEPVECPDIVFLFGREIECDEYIESWEPSKADADLIAAAPDLLEALKDALCALDCCGKDFPAASKARATIAKATGSTP